VPPYISSLRSGNGCTNYEALNDIRPITAKSGRSISNLRPYSCFHVETPPHDLYDKDDNNIKIRVTVHVMRQRSIAVSRIETVAGGINLPCPSRRIRIFYRLS